MLVDVVSVVTCVVVVVVMLVSEVTKKTISLLSRNFPPAMIGPSDTRILTV